MSFNQGDKVSVYLMEGLRPVGFVLESDDRYTIVGLPYPFQLGDVLVSEIKTKTENVQRYQS